MSYANTYFEFPDDIIANGWLHQVKTSSPKPRRSLPSISYMVWYQQLGIFFIRNVLITQQFFYPYLEWGRNPPPNPTCGSKEPNTVYVQPSPKTYDPPPRLLKTPPPEKKQIPCMFLFKLYNTGLQHECGVDERRIRKLISDDF